MEIDGAAQPVPAAPEFSVAKVFHILLVEDDAVTLKAVEALLRKCSYKVTTARNGREAMACLKASQAVSADGSHNGGRVDLILTDMLMPEVSGLELIVEVVRGERFAGIPVVVMSTQDTQESVLEAFQVGAASYLIKPVRLNEVATLWQHVWRANRLRSDSTTNPEVSRPSNHSKAMAVNGSNGAGGSGGASGSLSAGAAACMHAEDAPSRGQEEEAEVEGEEQEGENEQDDTEQDAAKNNSSGASTSNQQQQQHSAANQISSGAQPSAVAASLNDSNKCAAGDGAAAPPPLAALPTGAGGVVKPHLLQQAGVGPSSNVGATLAACTMKAAEQSQKQYAVTTAPHRSSRAQAQSALPGSALAQAAVAAGGSAGAVRARHSSGGVIAGVVSDAPLSQQTSADAAARCSEPGHAFVGHNLPPRFSEPGHTTAATAAGSSAVLRSAATPPARSPSPEDSTATHSPAPCGELAVAAAPAAGASVVLRKISTQVSCSVLAGDAMPADQDGDGEAGGSATQSPRAAVLQQAGTAASLKEEDESAVAASAAEMLCAVAAAARSRSAAGAVTRPLAGKRLSSDGGGSGGNGGNASPLPPCLQQLADGAMQRQQSRQLLQLHEQGKEHAQAARPAAALTSAFSAEAQQHPMQQTGKPSMDACNKGGAAVPLLHAYGSVTKHAALLAAAATASQGGSALDGGSSGTHYSGSGGSSNGMAGSGSNGSNGSSESGGVQRGNSLSRLRHSDRSAFTAFTVFLPRTDSASLPRPDLSVLPLDADGGKDRPVAPGLQSQPPAALLSSSAQQPQHVLQQAAGPNGSALQQHQQQAMAAASMLQAAMHQARAQPASLQQQQSQSRPMASGTALSPSASAAAAAAAAFHAHGMFALQQANQAAAARSHSLQQQQNQQQQVQVQQMQALQSLLPSLHPSMRLPDAVMQLICALSGRQPSEMRSLASDAQQPSIVVAKPLSSLRAAAVAKWREKRKHRNFNKKVRYESRKRLAESRPRVRGQFVKQDPAAVAASRTAADTTGHAATAGAAAAAAGGSALPQDDPMGQRSSSADSALGGGGVGNSGSCGGGSGSGSGSGSGNGSGGGGGGSNGRQHGQHAAQGASAQLAAAANGGHAGSHSHVQLLHHRPPSGSSGGAAKRARPSVGGWQRQAVDDEGSEQLDGGAESDQSTGEP